MNVLSSRLPRKLILSAAAAMTIAACGVEPADSCESSDAGFDECYSGLGDDADDAILKAQSGLIVNHVATLDFRNFDGRPTAGTGKHATWIGDRNGDGKPEYFVGVNKGATSTLFYSSGNKYKPTKHWYMPSYSVITLDVKGDARPEYLLKTSKLDRDDAKKTGTGYVDWRGDFGGHMTVFRIPDDPIHDPLEPVMIFPRSVPIVSGLVDLDGDGYKDLLVTEHTDKADFVAQYYKGKNDSDGKPFESKPRWWSDGAGTSMDVRKHEHKARWGDLMVIDKKTIRLFAAGAEDTDNNVIYWKYDPAKDTFDSKATVFDLSEAKQAKRNELNLTTVRALPGALMLSGKDGAFLYLRKSGDNYRYIPVPGIERKHEYPEYWCIPSGKRGSTKVIMVILRKRGAKAAMEFRIFDTITAVLSNIVKEVTLPSRHTQRIDVLRDDDSFDVTRPAKQLIVSHDGGASIYDVRLNM